jgi:hypothetical protein
MECSLLFHVLLAKMLPIQSIPLICITNKNWGKENLKNNGPDKQNIFIHPILYTNFHACFLGKCFTEKNVIPFVKSVGANYSAQWEYGVDFFIGYKIGEDGAIQSFKGMLFLFFYT